MNNNADYRIADDPEYQHRREIDRAYAVGAESMRVRHVLRQLPNGDYEVLQVLRINRLFNGLEIVVR